MEIKSKNGFSSKVSVIFLSELLLEWLKELFEPKKELIPLLD